MGFKRKQQFVAVCTASMQACKCAALRVRYYIAVFLANHVRYLACKFSGTLVRWFLDNFSIFADSFSVVSIHCVDED